MTVWQHLGRTEQGAGMTLLHAAGAARSATSWLQRRQGARRWAVAPDSMFQTCLGMNPVRMLHARFLQACHALTWPPLRTWSLPSKQVHADKHGHPMKSCSSNVCVGLLRRSWSRRGETAARPPNARGHTLQEWRAG